VVGSPLDNAPRANSGTQVALEHLAVDAGCADLVQGWRAPSAFWW